MRPGQAVRFPAPHELPAPSEALRGIGPVIFSLHFSGIERNIDFSSLRPERLVRPLAGALASIGGDDAVVRTYSPDFQQMTRHLRAFVGFVAEGAGAKELDEHGVRALRPEMLDDFEADLLVRFGPHAKRVHSFMATVVRLLRLVEGSQPGALSEEMLARLGYASHLRRYRSAPLDAYPMPVFDAIRQAALAEVAAIAERIDAGRRLAERGVDPQVGGWSARENVLLHCLANGPLVAAELRGLHVVRCAPGGFAGFNAQLFLTSADLPAFLVALICLTGLEPECAKALRSDCLSSPSTGFVTLAYDKKRAHSGTRKTLRVRDGAGLRSAGGLLRLAGRLSEAARAMLGSDALWVGASLEGPCAFFERGYELSYQLRSFSTRHLLGELADRSGEPVRLDLRRLRKSVKSKSYLASGGILDHFATGHTKAVAAAHYGDIDAHHELHDQAVEDGLRQALDAALAPAVTATCGGAPLAAPGASGEALSPAQAQAAHAPEQDVFLASCSDFHNSPFARAPGGPCPSAIWGCLSCPNAVFTERHLGSLVAFAAFVESQREELRADDWQARYGVSHRRIVTDIFPAFSPEVLAEARGAPVHLPEALVPARLLESLT